MISVIAFESLDQQLKVIQKQCLLLCQADSPLGEIIHDLRVNCRKGIACLDFYVAVIPKDDFDPLRSKLAKFLRKSSHGRDLDVMIHALENMSTFVPALLLRKLKNDRKKEFRSIRKRADKLSIARERKKLKTKLLEYSAIAPSDEHEGSIALWTKPRIQAIVEKLLCDSKVEEWTPKTIHRLRLRMKKLRYSLELASSFDSDIAVSIDSSLLAQIQRMLGEINDIAVRLRYFREYNERMKEPVCKEFLSQQINRDERELAERIDQWSRFWTGDCQAKIYGDLMTRTF